MKRLVPFLPVLALAACTAVPAVDARLSAADRAAAPPALVPLGPLLARIDAGAAVTLPSLDARIARLAARAAILRGPVLTPADRARLGL
jgi:hypothetical protein